ncbi:hypothetical protein AGLY_014865 [Aphis glycines]|uniref:Uncharacterized protein n=1 Tax=Aphis glycines TaxID=307491 RepID=A0A6G0T398_APHGL|nr:hypothetical protein AGLY_014865 [Aphis glycines]
MNVTKTSLRKKNSIVSVPRVSKLSYRALNYALFPFLRVKVKGFFELLLNGRPLGMYCKQTVTCVAVYTLSDTFKSRLPTAFKYKIQTYHDKGLLLSLLIALHARTIFHVTSPASLTDAVITGTADKLLLFENVRIFQFSLLVSIVLQVCDIFPFYPTEIGSHVININAILNSSCLNDIRISTSAALSTVSNLYSQGLIDSIHSINYLTIVKNFYFYSQYNCILTMSYHFSFSFYNVADRLA